MKTSAVFGCLGLVFLLAGCQSTEEPKNSEGSDDVISGRNVGEAVGPTETHRNVRFDEELEQGTSQSENLPRDITLMWKTVPNGEFAVSPVSAINAARRVFETVDLIGKTTDEVFALIGDNTKSSDSGYNFPFWPVGNGTVVYRFDCGNFGWQFNLKLDSSGRVNSVERKWIH
jgi:hypothetical protein